MGRSPIRGGEVPELPLPPSLILVSLVSPATLPSGGPGQGSAASGTPPWEPTAGLRLWHGEPRWGHCLFVLLMAQGNWHFLPRHCRRGCGTGAAEDTRAELYGRQHPPFPFLPWMPSAPIPARPKNKEEDRGASATMVGDRRNKTVSLALKRYGITILCFWRSLLPPGALRERLSELCGLWQSLACGHIPPLRCVPVSSSCKDTSHWT